MRKKSRNAHPFPRILCHRNETSRELSQEQHHRALHIRTAATREEPNVLARKGKRTRAREHLAPAPGYGSLRRRGSTCSRQTPILSLFPSLSPPSRFIPLDSIQGRPRETGEAKIMHVLHRSNDAVRRERENSSEEKQKKKESCANSGNFYTFMNAQERKKPQTTSLRARTRTCVLTAAFALTYIVCKHASLQSPGILDRRLQEAGGLKWVGFLICSKVSGETRDEIHPSTPFNQTPRQAINIGVSWIWQAKLLHQS
jgi:hypothetical protein